MSFFDYPDAATGQPSETDTVFLAGTTGEDWKTILRYVGVEPFVAGQVLVDTGDPGDAFFILVDGRVRVDMPGNFGRRLIATIERGSVFGEIAFLDGGTRTATVRAVTGGTLMRVTRAKFTNLQAWEPQLAQRIALELGRVCAVRLRDTLMRGR